MDLKSSIDPTNIPKHVAIIMDGNGRWAKKHSKPRAFGHKRGVKTVREITEVCAELGIKHLTVYAFSTENWARPKAEVSALMQLLVRTIKSEYKTLMKNDIRLKTIGHTSALPAKVRDSLLELIDQTSGNKRMDLILALNYSSRWELTEACKKIASSVLSGETDIEAIDESIMASYLETKNVPDPELLIRTSGEQRISNYLLWQIAYSELYFTEVLWPDFSQDDLYKAVLNYQNRERRFGMTSEQIKVG